MIILGMGGGRASAPDEGVIEQALQFLSHPSVALVHRTEDGYELETDFDNALDNLQALGATISAAVTATAEDP